MPRVNHYSPGQSFKGSTSSLASSSDGTIMRRKKKKAPAPPVPQITSQNGGTPVKDENTIKVSKYLHFEFPF